MATSNSQETPVQKDNDANVKGLTKGTEEMKIGGQPQAGQQHALISETVKLGVFYRLKNDSPNSAERAVIGVYAKSINYRGVDTKNGTAVKKLSDHVFSSEYCPIQVRPDSTKENNFLGVCFFGVWSTQSGPIVIQVPVQTKDDKPRSIIWETGDKRKSSDIQGFKHELCYGSHTEEAAKHHLENKETQKILWRSLWIAFNNQKQSGTANYTLECIGFHFFSSLDACDSCLETQLVPLQNEMRSCFPPSDNTEHKVTTPLPFVTTFTSKQFYKPYNYLFKDPSLNNKKSSASLRFNLALSLLLYKFEDKYKCCKSQTLGNNIKHQESIPIVEKKGFDFIVLTVNEGAPVMIEELKTVLT